jgi:hypothetical protein
MDNISFLKEILTSSSQYWVAAKKEKIYSFGEYKTVGDSVWIICIPHNISLFQNENEILLKDIEALASCEVHNIALSEPFAPFQHGVTLLNFYKGFPLEKVVDIKKFMIQALECRSDDIYAYEKIIERINRGNEVAESNKVESV